MLLSPLAPASPGSHCISKELHVSLVCPDGCHRPFLGTRSGSSPQEEEELGPEQCLIGDKASLPFSPGHHLSKLHHFRRGKLYGLRALPTPAPTLWGWTGPRGTFCPACVTQHQYHQGISLPSESTPLHPILGAHLTSPCLLYHLSLDKENTVLFYILRCAGRRKEVTRCLMN